MFRNMLCLVMVAVVCTGCISIHSEKRCTETKAECQKACPKMLKHIVLFKFKDGTTPEKIKEVEQAFASLPGKIDVIKGFEAGTNVSVENRSEGFTHCFVVSFLNEADRDAYLIHPDHKEFGKSLGGCIDKILVVDYWNR
ncbi:MAG: Dabb family protein [Sedimentisphaerales bacterium]